MLTFPFSDFSSKKPKNKSGPSPRTADQYAISCSAKPSASHDTRW